MTRRPRKPDEHLVSALLLGHAYGNMGEIATCGGFFTYNIIMQSYGFPFEIYFELLSKQAYINSTGITFNTYLGNPADTFNRNAPYLGYTNDGGISSTYFDGACDTTKLKANQNYPNWLSLVNNNIDLRAVYVTCCSNAPSNNYCPQFSWPPFSSTIPTISPISGHYVAFTTETIFYAQSGYFVTIVMIQWSNVFACKSRKVFFSLFR
jgi:sodium/potassium-transporting ATPase subunit alpha